MANYEVAITKANMVFNVCCVLGRGGTEMNQRKHLAQQERQTIELMPNARRDSLN